MAPSNKNQGNNIQTSPGYNFSQDQPDAVEPQKMSGPRGVDTPVDVKAEKVAGESRQNRTGIVDKGGARGAHPAFRQGNQVKEKQIEETAESEQENEEAPPNESVYEEPRVGSASDNDYVESVKKSVSKMDFSTHEVSKQEQFMGVQETTRPRKRVDPVETARRIREQVQVTESTFESGSMPANVKFAVRVARRWQGVPDAMSDAEAITAGFLSPEMIQLILTIAMSMFQDCLPNQPAMAWSRIQNFNSAKPWDKLADETRVSWIVDRWMLRMAYPRDKGDVRMIAKALAQEAASSSVEDFRSVQTEMLFMTV